MVGRHCVRSAHQARADAAFGLGGVWGPPGRLVHIHRSHRSGGGADQCYRRSQAPSAAKGAASRETSRPTPTCIHWRGRIRTHRNRSRLNSLEAIAAESEDLSAWDAGARLHPLRVLLDQDRRVSLAPLSWLEAARAHDRAPGGARFHHSDQIASCWGSPRSTPRQPSRRTIDQQVPNEGAVRKRVRPLVMRHPETVGRGRGVDGRCDRSSCSWRLVTR